MAQKLILFVIAAASFVVSRPALADVTDDLFHGQGAVICFSSDNPPKFIPFLLSIKTKEKTTGQDGTTSESGTATAVPEGVTGGKVLEGTFSSTSFTARATRITYLFHFSGMTFNLVGSGELPSTIREFKGAFETPSGILAGTCH